MQGAQWQESHVLAASSACWHPHTSPAWPCLQTPPLQRQLRLSMASSQRHLVAEKETRRWKPNHQPSPPGSLQAPAGGVAMVVSDLYLTCSQVKRFGPEGSWSPICPLPKYLGEGNCWANSPSLKIPDFTFYGKSICCLSWRAGGEESISKSKFNLIKLINISDCDSESGVDRHLLWL